MRRWVGICGSSGIQLAYLVCQVWVMPETGEVFVDYESYLNRYAPL